MILAIDVGNTNIVLGVYNKEDLVASWRISTKKGQTEDEYGILLKSFFMDKNIKCDDIEGAIISSVVPTITPILEKMCKKHFSIEPLIVGPGIKTGINIKYENPREVGADRIANAIAAYYKYGGPVIVVDFGTATTFDVISSNLDYLGGAIAPGVMISTEALFKTASKLYRVEITKPDVIIGKNSATSMQAGIFHGFVGMVDTIVDKMEEELGKRDIYTVATGGLAPLICSETKKVDTVDLLLTMDGLRILYEKNMD